jgi:hypothetical protein
VQPRAALVQVLIVGGQDLDGIRQRSAQVGRVVSVDAAADAEAGVGDLAADQLDPNTTVLAPSGSLPR